MTCYSSSIMPFECYQPKIHSPRIYWLNTHDSLPEKIDSLYLTCLHNAKTFVILFPTSLSSSTYLSNIIIIPHILSPCYNFSSANTLLTYLFILFSFRLLWYLLYTRQFIFTLGCLCDLFRLIPLMRKWSSYIASRNFSLTIFCKYRTLHCI